MEVMLLGIRRRAVAILLVLVLALGGCFAEAPRLKEPLRGAISPPKQIQHTTGQTAAPSTQPTDPPEQSENLDTQPPDTTQTTDSVPTQPSQPTQGYVGQWSLEELRAMDSENQGYGPGFTYDEKGRPYIAMDLNQRYGKYDAWFIGPDNGNIYLTFDLGWENDGLTHRILDTLKEKNVKAVFFVLHEYCEPNKDIIRRIIDEGHVLASHAYHHVTLADQPIDRIVREITDLHRYVLEEFGYEMELFRPPSGYFSEQVLAIAQGLGYQTVQWSYAYVDWLADDQPDPEEAMNKLVKHAHSGCIYLLHTVSTTNAQILGDLIDTLRAQGYEFSLVDF